MATSQPSAHTEVSSQAHGAFPPFQKETFSSQIVWLVIIFVALYLLMARIALPRIGSIMEARRSHIEGDVAEADRLKGESDAALAAYEQSLAEARVRAQAMANETHQKQAAATEASRKALEATLNAEIEKAERSIAATRTAAMTQVATIAGEAAAAIVERLIGTTPSGAQIADAVAAAIKR